MGRIYIFDIDGTLTPSRLQMTEKFSKYFDKWSKRNNIWNGCYQWFKVNCIYNEKSVMKIFIVNKEL